MSLQADINFQFGIIGNGRVGHKETFDQRRTQEGKNGDRAITQTGRPRQ